MSRGFFLPNFSDRLEKRFFDAKTGKPAIVGTFKETGSAGSSA